MPTTEARSRDMSGHHKKGRGASRKISRKAGRLAQPTLLRETRKEEGETSFTVDEKEGKQRRISWSVPPTRARRRRIETWHPTQQKMKQSTLGLGCTQGGIPSHHLTKLEGCSMNVFG